MPQPREGEPGAPSPGTAGFLSAVGLDNWHPAGEHRQKVLHQAEGVQPLLPLTQGCRSA